MASRARMGVRMSCSPPPRARVVNPSMPQAFGVILVTIAEPDRHVVHVDEGAAQDAEGQHDGRTDRAHLAGGFGDGGKQHAPADRAENGRQHQGCHGQRVAPLELEQDSRAQDQDEHLGHAGQEDADHLAAQHLGRRGRGDQQARQGALVAFGQERAPAVADGIHQEHQRHARGQQGQHVEFDGFAAGCDVVQRDGCALRGGVRLADAHAACPTCLGFLDLDAAAGDELRDRHLAADPPDLHLADELVQDGLDHADAGGRGGVGVELDLDDFAGGGLVLRWDNAVGEPGRDDDRRDGLIIVHLFVGGGRVV